MSTENPPAATDRPPLDPGLERAAARLVPSIKFQLSLVRHVVEVYEARPSAETLEALEKSLDGLAHGSGIVARQLRAALDVAREG